MLSPMSDQTGDRAEPETLRSLAARFSTAFYDHGGSTWQSVTWLGVPTKRYPTDLMALAEILAETRPELVIECGVFEGGGLLYTATILDALGDGGRVVGVDISLERCHPRVKEDPRIELIESSSIDPDLLERLTGMAAGKRTMVVLDSDHSATHVLGELEGLGPLVSEGCYLICEDGSINGRPHIPDFGPGPSEALHAFLPTAPQFQPDLRRERFGMTLHPGGFLLRVPDGEEPPPELREDPAGEPGIFTGAGGFPHPVADELESLQRTVRSQAESMRGMRHLLVSETRAARDTGLEQGRASAQPVIDALQDQAEKREARISDLQRNLDAERAARTGLSGFVPPRARGLLSRLKNRG